MGQALVGGLNTGYSIRVVSRLTAISADTLRMWERRYDFPKPRRNATGVRVYSQADVERLMLVARALKGGYRAGEVINKNREELAELVATAAGARLEPGSTPSSIQTLVTALERDDLEGLRVELRQSNATLGAKRFITDVAAPLVEYVGEAWARGQLEVRHEHALSEALSTQIRLLLAAYDGSARGPMVLLTTLPGEHHSLGLEMTALYIALAGATSTLLGVDTPPDQIVDAARALDARVVGLSVSAVADLDTVTSHVAWIARELPRDAEVWLGGKRARALTQLPARTRCVVEWNELDRELARILVRS